MDVVGIRRIKARGVVAELQYPRTTIQRGYCSYTSGRGPAARAMRDAGNAGRGASPTTGKREGFSF
jgi:hypothetical protein